jgi:hypothetical protein
MGRFGAAGCFAARWSRRGVATPRRLRVPARLAPPERGDEAPQSDRPECGPLDSGPEGRWFTPQHTGRSLHYRGRISVERPGAHGFVPGSDSYRGPSCGLSARCPRKPLPPALSRTKPTGASGQSRWRQRPCLRTRQRSKALRPADASGVGTRSSQLRLRPAQRPEPARRYRPSVTTGRLLTRETLRRVGHDRGRS